MSMFEDWRSHYGSENCGCLDYTRMAFEYAYNLGFKTAARLTGVSCKAEQPKGIDLSSGGLYVRPSDRLDGTERIVRERHRQVSAEGWTPQHDAEHRNGEMALAAVCYASPIPLRGEIWLADVPCACRSVEECTHGTFAKKEWRDPWPWESEWDKREKHPRIRRLEIAGALIAAEIDRLLALNESQCQVAVDTATHDENK